MDHFFPKDVLITLCTHFLKLLLFVFSRKKVIRRVRRFNPVTNTKAMLRLNPYAAVLKRQAILSAQKRKLSRDEELAKKRGVRRTENIIGADIRFSVTIIFLVKT